MHPSVLGGGVALVALLAWLVSRRQPVVVLRSTDASAVAALNRAQITLVQGLAAASSGSVVDAPATLPALDPLPAPGDARARARLLRLLDQQLQGAPADRLAAMRAAARWSDRATVPLLQRGLRDMDPEVVLTASQAMARFRGRTAAERTLALPLPRNAAPIA